MKNVYAILLLVLCCTASVKAQQLQGAWWYFGQQAGLNFNNEPPTPDFAGQTYAVGCASVSDTYGNLLFYSDGYNIYNKLHQKMPNGSIRMPGVSIDKVMIVQKPGSPNLYYLFSIASQASIGSTTPNFIYSIINIDLDGGKGDLDLTTKNTPVFTVRVASKVTASIHSNNQDIWVTVHNSSGNSFYTFLVSSAGISLPVVSNIGFNYLAGAYLVDYGTLKTSPNSALIADAVSYSFLTQLLDFNRTTGVLMNARTFNFANQWRPYGIAYSPDNSKLYLGAFDNIYQYNLGAGSFQDVLNSQVKINNNPAIIYNDIQLAMNGKLYILPNSNPNSNYYPQVNQRLSVINCPNNLGTACNFQDTAMFLGRLGGGNLPALNQTIFRNAGILQAQAFRDTICYGDSVQLSAYGAGAEHFQWQVANGLTAPNDTLANPFVKPTQTTTYSVTGTSVCSQNTASVTIVVLPKPVVTVSGSASVCPQVQGVWYKAQNPQKQQISWGVRGGVLATTSNDSISVNWGSASNTAQVWALPKNRLGCPGDTVFFPVNINVILATEKPKGADTLCLNEAINVTYRIHKTTGSIYTWGIQGGTIINGQNTNAIKINWPQSGKGKLWVQEESHTSTSHCFGVSDTLHVVIHPSPDSVKKIIGLTQVFTLAENQGYTVVNPQPGLVYNWLVNGGEIVSGQGNSSISVNWKDAGIGSVEVSATNEFACASSKASLKVNISGSPQPIFYNIITSNKDQKNDAFVIENLKWYADNELVIYNRWGVEVFRSQNYKNDWKAENLSSGTYFYRFQAQGKSWKGWLELVK